MGKTLSKMEDMVESNKPDPSSLCLELLAYLEDLADWDPCLRSRYLGSRGGGTVKCSEYLTYVPM